MARVWNRKSLWASGAVVGVIVSAFVGAGLVSADTPPAAVEPIYLDQGADWPKLRAQFYTQDQGSRMIPLAWVKALTGPDGKPFLADSLTRYGYLANPAAGTGLPVGFTTSGPQGSEFLGMSCAACHTRDIEVEGKTYRVDGGPAISDFQALLTDLRDAVGKVRADPAKFSAFAADVLGPNPTQPQIDALKSAVDLWYTRQNTLFSHAFPKGGWGLGRLDAVSMIFDRLTGLDIGPKPDGLIVANIKPADAPVRYPFLWNASRQDFTQWPGFAPNGDDILGLVRNLGEVYGVFADFAPKKDPKSLLKVSYLAENSANFDGLSNLETMIQKIGPPKWPFAIDAERVQRGSAIFARPTAQGGCADCHGIKTGQFRSFTQTSWATPLLDTGTDSREYDVLSRTADTGVLKGTGLPFNRLGATEKQFTLLSTSVAGSIAEKYTALGSSQTTGFAAKDAAKGRLMAAALPASQKDLLTIYNLKAPATKTAAPQYLYESRVLQGIWAAAPYLHNGSVASLADLLKTGDQRAASFAVGRAYDINTVGLAAVQPGSKAVRVTTGNCATGADRNSGESRCGHEFGTTSLTDAEKRDLLEYLKTL